MARKKTEGGPPRGGRKPGKWTVVTPEEIRAFRQDNQISRSRLAGALGVSSTTIQNWETDNGVAMPRLQQKVSDLIKAGPTALAATRGAAGAGGWDPSAIIGPQVLATGTIVNGYLQVQGTKMTPEQLIELIKSVRGALV